MSLLFPSVSFLFPSWIDVMNSKSGMTVWVEIKCPSHVLYNKVTFVSKGKWDRDRKRKNTKEFGLSFASYICTFSNWWFSMSVVRLTLAQRWEDVLSTASLPRPWWPSFSVMLITTFKPELMKETWPLRRGQGCFKGHLVFPYFSSFNAHVFVLLVVGLFR